MDRNGWSDWEHHVLLKLEDQGKKLDRLDEKQDGLKNDIISLESELEKKLLRCRGQCDADIVELKTKLKTGGAIAGTIGGLIIAFIFNVFVRLLTN